jgi:hypothetical protein
MNSKTLSKWTGISGSGPEPLLRYRFLKSPYGYVPGFVLWPLNLLFYSVSGVLLLSSRPSPVATVGSYVFIGAFALVSISSALVMAVTALNTPYERIRRQSGVLLVALLLAVPFFGLFDRWPTLPYSRELVGLVGDTIAHELFRLVFLGPAIGFAFVIFPLVVLGYRYALE